MTDTTPLDLRILVGAGSYADAAPAFRIVDHLTEVFRADVGGILVQENSLDLCQIRNQKLVQVSGATTLAPSLAQVRTLMQADARAFRQSLIKATRQSRTQSNFSQERGDLVQATLLAATTWDLLVIGYRQVHKMRGKIVVLGNPHPVEEPMEAIAVRLSDQLRAEQIRFGVQDASAVEPPGFFRFDTLEEILAALSHLNTEVVLLDLRQGPVQNQTDLARVLEAARCPVIVFGTATRQAQLAYSIQVPPVSTA